MPPRRAGILPPPRTSSDSSMRDSPPTGTPPPAQWPPGDFCQEPGEIDPEDDPMKGEEMGDDSNMSAGTSPSITVHPASDVLRPSGDRPQQRTDVYSPRNPPSTYSYGRFYQSQPLPPSSYLAPSRLSGYIPYGGPTDRLNSPRTTQFGRDRYSQREHPGTPSDRSPRNSGDNPAWSSMPSSSSHPGTESVPSGSTATVPQRPVKRRRITMEDSPPKRFSPDPGSSERPWH